MIFFRIKAGQLRVKQSTGPHNCVVAETVPQPVHGLFDLFLQQQLLCRIVKQGQLHVFVGGNKIDG